MPSSEAQPRHPAVRGGDGVPGLLHQRAGVRAGALRHRRPARGQKNAGLALGFTLGQTCRHVLLPMAFRLIVPPLTSEFLNIFKNSAVCSTIGLLELAAQGRQLVDYTAQPYESFIAVTVLYLLINVVVMSLMRVVEARTRVPGYLGPANEETICDELRIRLVLHPRRPALPVGGHEGVAGDHRHRGDRWHRVGHLLAMMRLGTIKPLAWFRRRLRQPVPGDPAGDGAAVVLPDRAATAQGLLQPRPEHRRAAHASAMVGFALFESAYYPRDHPRRHPERAKGQVSAASALGMTYAQAMRLVVLPRLPQHGAAAAHPGHRAVPGHLAGYVSALADFGAATRWATGTAGWICCSSRARYFVVLPLSQVRRLQKSGMATV